ncbi:riboflavin synthase [candidate division NPL-UPA2 bacterium]|nr:riboflavin synthase [candidate division NPL-UPA2 bacterium]
MFTGLIEELGRVEKIGRKGSSVRLTIRASTVLEDISIGASIAVNGVCLTIIGFSAESFSVDVVPETLKRTLLSRLHPGEKVNLERAVKAGDRLGGHLVTGHIDGLGEIKEKRRQGDSLILKIGILEEIAKYLVPQGSIAVDGISLTVVESDQNSFTVAIIPHTAEVTTLRFKTVGSYVNIEVDSLSKYVEKLMNPGEPKRGRITTGFLREQGFK